jgi:AraC family transcriptional regulator
MRRSLIRGRLGHDRVAAGDLVWFDMIAFQLLTLDSFASSPPRKIADAKATSEVHMALSCDSRVEWDVALNSLETELGMTNEFTSYQEFYSKGPYAGYLLEHRLVGTMTARVLHIRQPAGEFPDPPLPEYFLYVALQGANELAFDWGCGRWRGAWHTADISIAPPDVGTDISVDREHEFLGIALPKTLVVAVMNEVVSHTLSDLGELHVSTFADPAIVRWVHELWRCARADEKHCRLRNDSLMFGMLASVAQRLNAKEPPRRSLDDQRLRRVPDYVQEHLSENISLVGLAGIADLSAMHFARQFRMRTGLSPYQYVLRQRLQRAKMLLAATHHTLVDIAYETGFSSQAHLTSTFTRRVGDSPARYRLSCTA